MMRVLVQPISAGVVRSSCKSCVFIPPPKA